MARILLVDDDGDILQLGSALLNHAGHQTHTAENALEALNFLEHTRVDILVTDVNMPTHSGFDLVRFLRNDPSYVDLTVAVLTGRRERRDIEKALSLGVHDYIVKPLDPELFLKKVGDLLERRPPKTEDEDFASLKMNASARASFDVQIVSLSELGVIVRSQHPLNEGSRISLETELFMRIGIAAPAMRISGSEQGSGGWETRVSFVGTDEKTLSKIRAWIFTNSVRGRAA
jgi:DNA-binding response OmpR family regulator